MTTDKSERTGSGYGDLRPVQPLLLALFRRLVAKRRLRKNFRAVRLAFAERLPPATTEKLIFYLNHPSWWDPLLAMVLAERLIPGRNFYAPMEAKQLKRYRVLQPLGLFPVQTGTVRGAAQFLRAATAVLRAGDVLGLTAQGAFTDVRVRPPGIRPGLGTLLERMERIGEQITVVPVALEYTFWNQRLPEILVAIGHPLHTQTGSEGRRSAAAWTATLEETLSAAQDALAALGMTRNEQEFETVLEGSRGAAGIYGVLQRIWKGGKDVDHTSGEHLYIRKLPKP